MSKQKKKPQQVQSKILLATVLLELIKALIELINKLTE